MALDKVLKIYDEQGNPVDYDILAKDVKFQPDGKDLPTKLAEMEQEIEDAADGGYAPPAGGIPKSDLASGVQSSLDKADTALQQSDKTELRNEISNKVDKVTGKGLSTNDFTTALLNKLNGIAEGAQVNVINGINKYDGTPLPVGENGVVTLPNIEGGETVVVSVDDLDIVDNMDGANAATILAAASARMVKEIYLNLKALYQNLAGVAFIGAKPTWQTVARRTYTIGMASADQYITLTDGNGNAVSSPQDEGTPLTLRLSVANGYRFADVPTATMGSTNITFSLVGNVYVAEIGALSGNVVITASSTQVGTYSVSIPTGAVFCTSSGAETTAPSINEGEGVTCYIKPADGKRWATTPTSSAATVTLQSGSIYKIVASNVQADITVNGSTESIPTYAINLPSAGNGIASVALTDANNNAIQSPVLEGTAVKIVLTPSPNYRINVTSAKMGQQDLTPTNANGVLTYTINSVTGSIVITAVAEQVVLSKVYTRLLNVTDTTHNLTGKQDTTATVGETYTAVLEVDQGCTSNNDVRVLHGNVDVTSTAYNSQTGTVSVVMTDKPLSIIATANSGTLTITSTAAVTGGVTINGTSYNIDSGTTVINNIPSPITSLSFTDDAKTAVTALNFGGAVLNINSGYVYNSPFPRVNLTALTGLVNHAGGMVLYNNGGMPNLITLDTIGWRNCSLRALLSLEELDLVGFIRSTNTSLENVFNECEKLKNVSGFDTWDVSNITTLKQTLRRTNLFNYDGSDKVLDLSEWDTSSVTTIESFIAPNGGIFARPETLIIGENFNLDGVTSSTASRMAGGYDSQTTIKTIKVKSSTPPAINASYNWLANLTALTRIEIPDGSKSAYQEATGWSTYSSLLKYEGEN